jgi:hypothetical protein
MPFGSWPHLVKRGGLGVWHHFLVQRRGGKAASFLWGNFSISHIEVLLLPTSPNVAKSHNALTLLVKSRGAISNAMGVSVTKGMDAISLAFTRSR